VSSRRPSRAIADNLTVSKRDWIYVGLMLWITVGFAVDALVWSAGPTARQWNSVVQSFGIMLFVYSWERADGDQFGKRRSSLARLVTFFLPPVGHAIYLYQGRPWKPATALFLLFWAGVLGLLLVGGLALTHTTMSGEYP
jgi:hypothetical protein